MRTITLPRRSMMRDRKLHVYCRKKLLSAQSVPKTKALHPPISEITTRDGRSVNSKIQLGRGSKTEYTRLPFGLFFFSVFFSVLLGRCGNIGGFARKFGDPAGPLESITYSLISRPPSSLRPSTDQLLFRDRRTQRTTPRSKEVTNKPMTHPCFIYGRTNRSTNRILRGRDDPLVVADREDSTNDANDHEEVLIV